jgi:hypothetical protein
MMIVLNVKGGLGNQIFQLAAAYSYMRKNGLTEIFIFNGNINYYSSTRIFQLDKFLNKSPFNIKQLGLIWMLTFNKYMLFLFSKINIFIINENNFYLKPNALRIIDGYFHSVNYIESDSINLLKMAIRSDQDILLRKLPMFLTEAITDRRTLGVHLRLGDRMDANTLTRFKNNFLKMNLKPYDKIVFFSDEPSIRNTINEFIFTEFIFTEIIYINDFGLNDYEEFLICSIISNFYVSNSTFSITARLLALNNVLTFYSGNDFIKFGEEIPNLLSNYVESVNIDNPTV